MRLSDYKVSSLYVDGHEMNHFAFYEKTGKFRIRSWFWFIFDTVTKHIFKLDPDICARCGVFVG